LPISENVIARMEIGVMFLDRTDMKNAITIFRSISLNVDSVESWLAIGVGEIDCNGLV